MPKNDDDFNIWEDALGYMDMDGDDDVDENDVFLEDEIYENYINEQERKTSCYLDPDDCDIDDDELDDDDCLDDTSLDGGDDFHNNYSYSHKKDLPATHSDKDLNDFFKTRGFRGFLLLFIIVAMTSLAGFCIWAIIHGVQEGNWSSVSFAAFGIFADTVFIIPLRSTWKEFFGKNNNKKD